MRALLSPLAAAPSSEGRFQSLDPASFLSNGPLERFWRRHFPGKSAAPANQLLAALSKDYEPLVPAEQEELLAWLRPDDKDLVSVADAALILDGPGVWRGVLFCTSWTELCPSALLRAITAASPDDVVAQEQQRSVLLPEWCRTRLRVERGALHLFRVLGLQAAVDVLGGGLLVQFAFPGIAEHVLQGQSQLSLVCRELLGGEVLRASGDISMAHCVSEMALSRFEIKDVREQHIVLSRIHRRMQRKLEDDAEEMLVLQERHTTLVDNQLREQGEVDRPPSMRSISSHQNSGKAADAAGGERSGLRTLLFDRQTAAFASLQLSQLQTDAELRWNASGSMSGKTLEAQEAIEQKLESMAVSVGLQDQEDVLAKHINLCLCRHTQVRLEMSEMENTLVSLEANFAKSRRALLKREVELAGRIGNTEGKLAALSGNLAGRREAAREAEDALFDMRQELAEGMVVLPGPTDAIIETSEAELAAEVQMLRSRVRDLQKRYAKAKAAAKKR